MPGQFNIRQLEAFYWIMRLGGFGMAAQKLGATQPAVSARIKELEQSLGTSLFERGSKVLRPTASARTLYPLASEVLSAVARISNEISNNEMVSGTVRIGMGEIVALSWFPSFLARLKATYPAVQLDIHMDVTTNLHRMLEEGRIDLALVSTPGSASFHAESVGSTPLRWMASPSLVGSSTQLTPEELGALPIYSLHRNSNLHARMLKWFWGHGVRPSLVHTCNNLSVIIKLLQIGCGVALIPPILVREELQRGSLQIVAPHTKGDATEFFLVRYQDVIDPTILKMAAMALQTTVFGANSSN